MSFTRRSVATHKQSGKPESLPPFSLEVVLLLVDHFQRRLIKLQRERELVGTSLQSIRVDKDKVSRALPVASRAEAGKLKLVRGEWISDFLDEATSFPHGAHDDQIDAVSGCFQMIASPQGEWKFTPRSF